MGGLTEPSPLAERERDSNLRPILLGVALVVVVVGAIALLTRGSPKNTTTPHPYASNLKLSDLKMSAAENFIGHTVSYIDGTISNSGDKTVTHAGVEVTFKDDIGQVAQREETPLQVIRSNGAYPEPVDLSVSPLAPGQSEPFRLTFDSISAQWNRQYPEIRVTDVTVK